MSNSSKSQIKLKLSDTKLGRPKRASWERYRILAWAAVIAYADLPIESRPGGERFRFFYKNGARSPSRETLEKIDALLPGTLAFHNSPIWELLSLKKVGVIQPKDLFKHLPNELRIGWTVDNWTEAVLWRERKSVTDELTDVKNVLISKKRYVEAIVSITLLIHEAIFIQDIERLSCCFEEWASLYKFVKENRIGVLHDAIYFEPSDGGYGVERLFKYFGIYIYRLVKNTSVVPQKNSITHELFGL